MNTPTPHPNTSAYEMVIGLEVHCQLLTASKMFAADANAFGSAPNTNVGVVTLAHPGTLPKPNRKAFELAIRMGLACGCDITRLNTFDRKNYFYPDLPKGYQLTQDKTPILRGGCIAVTYKTADGRVVSDAVALHHVHLEEDAGKSVHDADSTQTALDFNRAGVPLIEMVTDPGIRSAEEAAAFLTEIRKLVRFLDICDGNMEEGSLRCDVNVSVRKKGETALGTKVEIKNMNSIRNVQRAIEAEFARQVTTVENGEKIQQETRSFDADTGRTTAMRLKETMNDYRYFPDPDLSSVLVSEQWIKAVKAQMPELPNAVFERFVAQYGLSDYDANQLTDSKETAQYFDELCQHTTNYKAASNWMTGAVRSYLNEYPSVSLPNFALKPAQIAAIIALTDSNQISTSVATQKLFSALMAQPNQTPLALAQQNGWLQNNDSTALETWIEEVMTAMPDKVKEYQKGKKGLLGLFVGEVMKKSKGTADPVRTNQLMTKKLEKA